MKRTRFARRVAALALALFALAGCGKSTKSVSSGPPTGTPDDLARLIQSAFLPGAVVPTNVDTTASILFTLNVGGLRGASALFLLGPPPTLANAGAVSVGPVMPGGGDVAVDAYALAVFGSVQTVYTTFVAHPAGVGLPFDGTTRHHFSVAGSSSFPAFADTILSVSLPVIATPAASASVPRTSDLTVSWSDAGSDTTVYVIVALESRVDTTQAAYATLVRDADGSAVVPATRLGTLPAGEARLSVARFRMRQQGLLSLPGRKVAVICEAASLRAVTLN